MSARRERFRRAQHFALYYGVGEAKRLADYDAAIVEPAGQSAENVAAMQRAGTLVLAYASVMEIAPAHPSFRLLATDDFLAPEGHCLENRDFGTRLLDLRSARWRGLLDYEIGRRLLVDGYDGIFLDTIADAESPILPVNARDAQIRAAADWVGRLRALFPDRIFVQNNGFERLAPQTVASLDGICWENPAFGQPESEAWHAAIVERLASWRESVGIVPLLLQEAQGRDADKRWAKTQQIAAERQFLAYFAGPNYTRLLPQA